MGSGSTKVMRQSEWVKVRAKADTVTMIEQRVTQIQSEKGLFCGEGGEEFLQRDRVDLEIYLEDIPDFMQLHLKNFILRRSNMQPYDLRQFAAYQLGRLLWMGAMTDVELEGRFLLGLRDRHTPLIQLLSDKSEDRKVAMEMDVRVNINGDSLIHHLLSTDETMRKELSSKVAFAEAMLDADLLEAKHAKNPTMEFLTGDGKRLFRKKRVNDLPDAPRLSDYEAEHLPELIRMYYEALYRSALWRRYQELKFGKPAELPAPPPPPVVDSGAYPEAAPPPALPPPPPQALSPVVWPVERDPYDYTQAPYPNPPQMWADPVAAPALPAGPTYPGAGAMVPLARQPDPYGPAPTNLPSEWPGPMDPSRPNGNYNNYAGPTYQMFLPTQY